MFITQSGIIQLDIKAKMFGFTLLLLLMLQSSFIQLTHSVVTTDNVCTFRTSSRLFSLTYLQRGTPYKLQDQDNQIFFNFCFPFTIQQCPSQTSSFSFVITKIQQQDVNGTTQDQIQKRCSRYSSNSTLTLFEKDYIQKQETEQSYLKLTLYSEQLSASTNVKKTQFMIRCSERQDFYVSSFEVDQQRQTLFIEGNSYYGCPVLQISSIWKVFQNNTILFGIVLLVIGFYLMFYGRSAIDVTVFIAVMFNSVAAIASIFTLFISPNSSNLAIYSSFIFILFVSCLLGYMATKLISVSVFFIGAFFGMIIGLLFSSMFSKMFNIYAQWTVILFVLLFSIPCGLLTFKYHDDVIIISTAFTGAYLVVRPFSWMIGGFPNQFLLYQAVQSNEIKTLPWSFFIYVLVMIILAWIGASYQRLKQQREIPGSQVQINIIQQNIEAPIDIVKVQVDKLIQKFRSEEPKVEEGYHEIKQKIKMQTK